MNVYTVTVEKHAPNGGISRPVAPLVAHDLKEARRFIEAHWVLFSKVWPRVQRVVYRAYLHEVGAFMPAQDCWTAWQTNSPRKAPLRWRHGYWELTAKDWRRKR
jgi:hypothetical protein